MTTLKTKDIRKMDKGEREKKLEELKFEMVKARASKTGASKAREIRKIVARILTLNNQDKNAEVVQNK